MKPALSLLLILTVAFLHAQDSMPHTAIQVPAQFTSRVDHKISNLDDRLTRQCGKYLRKLSRQEEKLRRKLAKVDSSKAADLFSDTKKTYAQLSQKLATANGKMNKAFSGQYLPGLDSLQGALGFLKEAKNLVSKSKDIQQQLNNSL
ncbi:MAG TPA: hypothetical protein PLL71_01275 [Agriterribacter sp.]|nr:hypothetical protein [Agriterribacter sp.]